MGGTYTLMVVGFDGPTNNLNVFFYDAMLNQLSTSFPGDTDPETLVVSNLTANTQYYVEVQEVNRSPPQIDYTFRVIDAMSDEFDLFRFVPDVTDNYALRLTQFGAQDLDLYIFDETFDQDWKATPRRGSTSLSTCP